MLGAAPVQLQSGDAGPLAKMHGLKIEAGSALQRRLQGLLVTKLLGQADAACDA